MLPWPVVNYEALENITECGKIIILSRSISFTSAFQTEGKLYLVLEFLRGGDLFTRLSKEVSTFSSWPGRVSLGSMWAICIQKYMAPPALIGVLIGLDNGCKWFIWHIKLLDKFLEVGVRGRGYEEKGKGEERKEREKRRESDRLCC